VQTFPLYVDFTKNVAKGVENKIFSRSLLHAKKEKTSGEMKVSPQMGFFSTL
jgi:hypothetical protein